MKMTIAMGTFALIFGAILYTLIQVSLHATRTFEGMLVAGILLSGIAFFSFFFTFVISFFVKED